MFYCLAQTTLGVTAELEWMYIFFRNTQHSDIKYIQSAIVMRWNSSSPYVYSWNWRFLPEAMQINHRHDEYSNSKFDVSKNGTDKNLHLRLCCSHTHSYKLQVRVFEPWTLNHNGVWKWQKHDKHFISRVLDS